MEANSMKKKVAEEIVKEKENLNKVSFRRKMRNKFQFIQPRVYNYQRKHILLIGSPNSPRVKIENRITKKKEKRIENVQEFDEMVDDIYRYKKAIKRDNKKKYENVESKLNKRTAIGRIRKNHLKDKENVLDWVKKALADME